MEQLKDLIGPTGIASSAGWREGLLLLVMMVAGGLIGHFVRMLYRRYASTVSNRDSFSATFPLLMLATVLVIFIIKSSLALSLGLVGALSIVRFRAAIKEPEEIVYLFFCIAVGIALGAKYVLFAIGGVVIFTVFVVVAHRLRGKSRIDELMLTITGGLQEMSGGDLSRFTHAVAETIGRLTVQRLDVEDGQVQYRVAVSTSAGEVGQVVSDLQTRLPGCRVSYVNLRGLV